MIKSAARKVIWVGRATVFLVGLAVILALVLGVATTAMGAAPGTFKLGQINTSNAISTLVGAVGGPNLKVQNTGTGSSATALELQVAQGKPPLTVNSDAGKATNLDADELDGQDSAAFLGANQKAADSDKLDGQDASAFARADQFGSAVNAPIFDGSGGLNCYLGEVRLFAGAAPGEWAKADGQLLSISQNTALFSLLGSNYGGDGRTTFALPDLRGAEPKGAGPAAPYYAICVQGVYP